MKKKYAIYKHNQYHSSDDKRGWWELHRKYENMDSAMDALRDLTRRPKKQRIYVYTILPVLDHHKRYVLLKEEYIDELLNKAR